MVPSKRSLEPRRFLLVVWLVAALGLLSASAFAMTASSLPPMLQDVSIEQRLQEQISPDLMFREEAGRPVRLGEYFGRHPIILALAYYDCPMLCGLVLEGLAHSLRALSFNIGEQFSVVTVSFDPDETPAQAAAKKAQYLHSYARPGAAAGWHFLTGDEAAIRQLTETVGFRYAYDTDTGQFAHAAGIMVLTPQGQIARYLFGIEFSPRDVRLALVEAAAGKIGSAVDRLLLFCYQYDPVTGRYGLLIMNVLRLSGLATVAVLGSFLVIMFRRERLRSHES